MYHSNYVYQSVMCWTNNNNYNNNKNHVQRKRFDRAPSRISVTKLERFSRKKKTKDKETEEYSCKHSYVV